MKKFFTSYSYGDYMVIIVCQIGVNAVYLFKKSVIIFILLLLLMKKIYFNIIVGIWVKYVS